jgi:hypothetical protein
VRPARASQSCGLKIGGPWSCLTRSFVWPLGGRRGCTGNAYALEFDAQFYSVEARAVNSVVAFWDPARVKRGRLTKNMEGGCRITRPGLDWFSLTEAG